MFNYVLQFEKLYPKIHVKVNNHDYFLMNTYRKYYNEENKEEQLQIKTFVYLE